MRQEGMGNLVINYTAGKKKDTAREKFLQFSTAGSTTISTLGNTQEEIQEELEQERLIMLKQLVLKEQCMRNKAQIAEMQRLLTKWDEEERKRLLDEADAYNEVRPVFEKIWDFNQKFVPLDAENASKKQMSPEKEKSPEKIMKEKSCLLKRKCRSSQRTTAKREESPFPRKHNKEETKNGCRTTVQVSQGEIQFFSTEVLNLLLWEIYTPCYEPDEDDEIWKDNMKNNLFELKIT
ncbi:hypothetical protein Tco_0706620 [Tanacetum coccineum]|uniref:Uncharacterized protein n=1 Tax=Tanacetum coccineum TaxID=301880 RepID=A0ABQ4Y7W2_9ASTR